MISNPPSCNKWRADGGDKGTAFRSNVIRRMMYRVPGFHELFSHNANRPPGRREEYTVPRAAMRSAGGM
jgi:hypothetical protein